MPTLKTLQKLALALPGVEEGLSYGTQAFRVRKKLIARVLPDEKFVVVRVGHDSRDALLDLNPKAYSVTPHYENSSFVVVRLATVPTSELKDILAEAWRLRATSRAIADYDGAH